MSEEDLRLALLALAIAFVLLVVLSGVLPLRARREAAAARLVVSRAVSIGSNESRPIPERVAALVRAGRAALSELKRPRLAAHHAEWAHRLAPADPEVLELAIEALTAARAFARLERILWETLDLGQAEAARARALEALATLYEGPLRRPERARALRRLAGPRPEPG